MSKTTKPNTKPKKNGKKEDEPKSLNRREKIYKMIPRDFSTMVKVRVNEKTEILIEPTADPIKAKADYLKRHEARR